MIGFAVDLAAAEHALDRQLADRYRDTAVTRDACAPAPLPLAEVHADGSADVSILGCGWASVEITPAMTDAVEAYLAGKDDDDRAALAALIEVTA